MRATDTITICSTSFINSCIFRVAYNNKLNVTKKAHSTGTKNQKLEQQTATTITNNALRGWVDRPRNSRMIQNSTVVGWRDSAQTAAKQSQLMQWAGRRNSRTAATQYPIMWRAGGRQTGRKITLLGLGGSGGRQTGQQAERTAKK